MNDAITFRKYAEDCRRLAKDMPRHSATLLEIADAWIRCAEAAERGPKKSDRSDTPDE
jgi:hypothetical protein